MHNIKNTIAQLLDLARDRHILERLQEIRTLEYLPKEEVRALQQKKLQALLLHSYTNVPYYRRVLAQAKVVEGDQVHLENFHQIPFLTKDILRTRFEDLKSQDADQRRWKNNKSSGSTGEPSRFIQDHQYDDSMMAVKILFDMWSGCLPGHRKALIWGAERDFFVGQATLRVRFSRWLRNQLWLNAFKMTPKLMEDYIGRMNRFKPEQILTYVESLYEIARVARSKNLSVHSPKSVMTTAGMLHPHMRALIEEVFAAPVFNRYGSREVGDIACECEKHEGLHVMPYAHLLEIVNPDGTLAEPGVDGEVAITLLTNHCMPLIRYKIGDRAVWSEKSCTCGRNWPVLKSITGRVTEIFKTKEGGIVPSEYFYTAFFGHTFIRQYQIIQEDYSLIKLNLVFSDPTKPKPQLLASPELKEIEQKIKYVMGQDCAVVFESVEHIPPTSSGKFLHVFSLVK